MKTTSVGNPNLIVYVREACHLCQEMVALLQQYQQKIAFNLEIVDIDDDPKLVQQYNELIPVLIGSNNEQTKICHYRLDIAALDAYFNKIR